MHAQLAGCFVILSDRDQTLCTYKEAGTVCGKGQGRERSRSPPLLPPPLPQIPSDHRYDATYIDIARSSLMRACPCLPPVPLLEEGREGHTLGGE